MDMEDTGCTSAAPHALMLTAHRVLQQAAGQVQARTALRRPLTSTSALRWRAQGSIARATLACRPHVTVPTSPTQHQPSAVPIAHHGKARPPTHATIAPPTSHAAASCTQLTERRHADTPSEWHHDPRRIHGPLDTRAHARRGASRPHAPKHTHPRMPADCGAVPDGRCPHSSADRGSSRLASHRTRGRLDANGPGANASSSSGSSSSSWSGTCGAGVYCWLLRPKSGGESGESGDSPSVS
jgi:hypothetical protein